MLSKAPREHVTVAGGVHGNCPRKTKRPKCHLMNDKDNIVQFVQYFFFIKFQLI